MVRLVEIEARRPLALARITGEELLRLFEVRLDSREAGLAA